MADDHTLVRGGICALLKAQSDFIVIGETGSGREAVSLCRTLNPDVLLLDLSIPDIDGLEVTKQIVAATASVKIIILTMYENDDYASRVLTAGAKGFLVKRISPEELPTMIRRVAAGEICVTESILKQIALKKTGVIPSNMVSTLSDRELQIFNKLAQGYSSTRIANDLCISTSSVATYKSRIMEKLGVSNNSELMRFALRLGLIDKFE